MEKEKKCFKCGQTGHLSNKCNIKNKKMKCFLCGKIGHFKNECPEEKEQKEEKENENNDLKYKGKSCTPNLDKKKMNKRRERGQKKEIIINEIEYAKYPHILIKYIDFHCNYNVYPSSYNQLNVFDDEIQLEYFLGAILSIPLDSYHHIFPEDILENPNHLYLIGIPSSNSLQWIEYLQSESLFDPIESFPDISLELQDFLKTFQDPTQSFLNTGKLYLQSTLNRYSNQIIGIGPIGLDYSDINENSIDEDEIKQIRWKQSLVVYTQILTFIDYLNSSPKNIFDSNILQINNNEINNLPQPPIESIKLKSGDDEKNDEDEEDNVDVDESYEDNIEIKELSNEDPLLLSYNSISSNNSQSINSSSLSKYILISVNGHSTSSYHLIDLVCILSTLFPQQQQQGQQQGQQLQVPYILIQLNSSLNYRTIQYLLSKYPNLYFTVDGRITHTKQKLLREYLFDIPLERIVIESNSPLYPPVSPPSYSEHQLPPLPEISPSYHPGYLLIIAATIGSVKRISEVNQVLDVCWENTCKILGLK